MLCSRPVGTCTWHGMRRCSTPCHWAEGGMLHVGYSMPAVSCTCSQACKCLTRPVLQAYHAGIVDTLLFQQATTELPYNGAPAWMRRSPASGSPWQAWGMLSPHVVCVQAVQLSLSWVLLNTATDPIH